MLKVINLKIKIDTRNSIFFVIYLKLVNSMVDKEKKMIFGIGIVFLFLATVTFSYAYFTATLVNNNVKDQVVQTGTLELTYTDGPEIVMNNIKPGTTITKEISVKNTGTLDTSYNLVWKELVNEITSDEMVIEATCTRLNSSGVEEGTCESLSSTPIKRIKIKENVSIESNITHKYNITITFKETNAEQNYNQGKKFTGTLGINEYVDNTPIYCIFDGEMVQGAEYVNGQYTYRYMQERYHDGMNRGDFSWGNMSVDGWGVRINTYNEDVTSKLCTYINNKPIVSTSLMTYRTKTKSIDLSSYNTDNVVNMSMMFEASDTDPVLNLDLCNFDTSNVTNMKGMFFNSKATTIDLSNFNTSNVTDMSDMFAGSKATTLDLSSFDTSNVTNMSRMFNSSAATTLNLSSFNTSNVPSMRSMFFSSAATTLDLSSFDTSNVTDMSCMFYKNTNLKTIYASDKFNTNSVTSSTNMFYNTTNLVGGAGTTYNSSFVDKTYARIDGGTSSPGYFTLKNS